MISNESDDYLSQKTNNVNLYQCMKGKVHKPEKITKNNEESYNKYIAQRNSERYQLYSQ